MGFSPTQMIHPQKVDLICTTQLPQRPPVKHESISSIPISCHAASARGLRASIHMGFSPPWMITAQEVDQFCTLQLPQSPPVKHESECSDRPISCHAASARGTEAQRQNCLTASYGLQPTPNNSPSK